MDGVLLDVCDRRNGSNQAYVRNPAIFSDVLHWQGESYSNPIFGTNEYTGSGTLESPYRLISTGQRFVRGDLIETSGSFLVDSFYEICTLVD